MSLTKNVSRPHPHPHPQLAKAFNADQPRTLWHDQSLWLVREKRDKVAKSLNEWEDLRSLASQIKTHTMGHLDHYLEQFEQQATARGIQVHYARDDKEHNEIVHRILNPHQAKNVIKSKSMLTEECGLNPYLEQQGITVIDSDLGERILQLRGEPPSHIVMPAIHLKKEEISETFSEKLSTEKGNADPEYLTRSAREHLRQKFLSADAAITGVNFAVADTGGIVVCTNEGNADMGASLPQLHIACMGLEKVVPTLECLAVFVRLLARSATGQPITSYTSHFWGANPGGEMHVVIVDNGRTEILRKEKFTNALNCIRCGACINTCPVYRRSGGHSYSYVIPGPIGSTLGALKDSDNHHSLPFACSLCGSCTQVCPVKIDLHHQLYHHRQHIRKSLNKKWIFKGMAWVMAHPKRFSLFSYLGKKILGLTPKSWMTKNSWGKFREMPEFPKKSFKQIYKGKSK